MRDMGKWNAAPMKSGQPVDHSDPELRVGPTLPATAGRKPETCPASQRKSGRECEGGTLAIVGGEAAESTTLIQLPPLPEPLDTESLSRVIGFFRKLDQWERQTTSQEVM
jgi:hypothetical protein